MIKKRKKEDEKEVVEEENDKEGAKVTEGDRDPSSAFKTSRVRSLPYRLCFRLTPSWSLPVHYNPHSDGCRHTSMGLLTPLSPPSLLLPFPLSTIRHSFRVE